MQLSEYTSQQRGAKSALARALALPPQLIGQWANGLRPVPVIRCLPIEEATQGAVTRKDLRPTDWQDIWPELAKPQSPKRKEVAHG